MSQNTMQHLPYKRSKGRLDEIISVGEGRLLGRARVHEDMAGMYKVFNH